MSGDPRAEAGYEAALAQLEEWGRQSQQQLARAEAVQDTIGRTQVTATSPGRDVRVTLDGTGLLVGVELEERALAATGLTLGRTVTRAIRAALARVPDEVVAAVEGSVGAGDPLAASVREQYEQAFVDVTRDPTEP
jgi:DNA-binding protein YbaB